MDSHMCSQVEIEREAFAAAFERALKEEQNLHR